MTLVLTLALALLAGCERPQPKESEETIERLRQGLPGITEKCLDTIRFGGIESMPKPVDKCFEMEKSRRWRGVWADEFEGQQFCAGETTSCVSNEAEPFIWLTFADGKRPTPELPSGQHYQIEFIGRRTLRAGFYGHMGVATHEVIADRVLSITPIQKQSQ